MESQDVSWRFHPRQVYREVKSFQVICFHHLESEFHNGKPQGQHRLSGEKVVVQCGDAIGREISAGHDHGAASTQLHREVQRRCMTTQMNSMAWHSQRTSIGACNWNRGQAPCTIESRRLAVDVLVEKGRGAFHEFLAHEGVPSFLNSREGRYIRHNLVHPARRPSYEPDGYGGSGSDWDGGNGDGSSVSGTYWPVFSDVAAPELDLGWPMSWGRQGSCTGRSCGSSGAATYFHPPSTDGSPSIKQVVHRLIEGARTVLAIATDVFTDIDVFQDVLNASIYRRIPVYILLDSLNAPLFEEMCRKLNVPFHQLDNLRVRTIAGVPFHCKSGIKFLGQMFEKFLLVDCHTVLCGTYRHFCLNPNPSFTWSFEKIHRSVAHVFTGTAASDFDEEFRLLYAQSQTLCPGQSPPSVMAQAHYNFPERASMQPYKTAQASQQVPVVCFQSPNYLHAIPPYLAAEESFESSSGSSRKAIWKGPWGEKPSRFPAAHFTHEDAFEKTKNNRIGFQWHNPANWRSGGDWPTEQETWQGSGRKGNDSNTRQPAGERKTLQGQLQWGWEYVGKPGLQINSKDQNRFESPYFALAHRTQFEDTASPKVAPGGFRPLCLNTAKIAQAQPRNEALPAEVWGQKNIDMQWNSVHTQNTNGLPETQLLPTWLTYETNREWPKGRPRTAEGNLRPRPRGNDDFDTNAQERNLHRASRLRPSLIYHSLPRLPARSRFTGKHHIDVKGKVSAMQEIPHENDREETIAARLNNQPVENKTPIYNRGAVLGYARNYQLTSRQKTVGIHETSLSSHVQLNQKMRNDDRAVSKVYSNNFISNEKLQKQSRIDKPTTRIEAVASEEKVNSSEQQWEGKFPGTENDEYQERVMENEDKHDDTTVGKPASLGASLIVLLQRSNLKDDTKALLKDMSAKGQQQAASATIEEEKVNERQVCINRGGERAKESREMAEVGEPKAENLVQKAEVMRRDNRVFSRFEVLMNPDGEKEDRRETSISKQEASEVEDSNKDVGKSTDDKKKSPDTRYINTTSGQRALVRDKQSTRDLNNREEKSRVIEAVDDIPGRRCKVKISPGRRHPERCRPGYGLAAQSRSSLLENYWKR